MDSIKTIPKHQVGKKIQRILPKANITQDNTANLVEVDTPEKQQARAYTKWSNDNQARKVEEARKLDMAKKGQTELGNFFSDLGTNTLTQFSQFRLPTKEEIEAGRSGWKERVPMINTAASHGMANELAGGAMDWAANKVASGVVGESVGKLANKLDFRFKPDPTKAYRKIGDEAGLQDAIASGRIRPNPNGAGNPSTVEGINLSRPSDVAYYQKGFPNEQYPGKYMVESQQPMYGRGDVNPVTGKVIKGRHYGAAAIDETGAKVDLPIDQVKFYQKHWLKGYKEIQPSGPITNANQSGTVKDLFARVPTATPEGEAALTQGNKWLQEWHSNPVIQDRIKRNNEEQLMYSPWSDKIDPKTSRLNVELVNDVVNDNAVRAFNQPLTGPSTSGTYVHDISAAPEALRGRAFVKPDINPADITSVAIHEGSHQLTNGGRTHSPQTDRLLKSMFDGDEGINLLKSFHTERPNLQRRIDYLTEPTEIHARLNQIRHHYGFTPEREVLDHEVPGILSDIAAEKTPISAEFGMIVSDHNAFRNALNKMFTPAATVGGAYLVNKKK